MALIGTRELAHNLGCSERSINNLVERGTIPFYKYGPKLVRFDLQQVLQAVHRMPSRQEQEDRDNRKKEQAAEQSAETLAARRTEQEAAQKVAEAKQMLLELQARIIRE